MTVDLVTMNSFDQTREPLLFLSCGHAFTVETLDGHMELGKHYSKLGGSWRAPVRPAAGANDPVRACPLCKEPISQEASFRYGRPQKAALLNQVSRKFLTWFAVERDQIRNEIAAERDRARLKPAIYHSLRLKCSKVSLITMKRHRDC